MKTENDMLKKLVQDELEKEAEQIKREMEQGDRNCLRAFLPRR